MAGRHFEPVVKDFPATFGNPAYSAYVLPFQKLPKDLVIIGMGDELIMELDEKIKEEILLNGFTERK